MKKITIFLAALLLGGARLGAQSLILTSDEQLNDLMDPDKKLDLSLGYTPYHACLLYTSDAADEL